MRTPSPLSCPWTMAHALRCRFHWMPNSARLWSIFQAHPISKPTTSMRPARCAWPQCSMCFERWSKTTFHSTQAVSNRLKFASHQAPCWTRNRQLRWSRAMSRPRLASPMPCVRLWVLSHPASPRSTTSLLAMPNTSTTKPFLGAAGLDQCLMPKAKWWVVLRALQSFRPT